jgi:hypothetical protein
LIIFFRYQTSPRFIKAIAHPLRHPAIQGETIEANHPSVLDERDLSPANPVVERMHAHAQVTRRGLDIEPSGFEHGFSGLPCFE